MRAEGWGQGGSRTHAAHIAIRHPSKKHPSENESSSTSRVYYVEKLIFFNLCQIPNQIHQDAINLEEL